MVMLGNTTKLPLKYGNMSSNAYDKPWKFMVTSSKRSIQGLLPKWNTPTLVTNNQNHENCQIIKPNWKKWWGIKWYHEKIEKWYLHFTKSQGAKTP